MPASPEKDTFGVYLTGAVADLNSWMDIENAKRRRLIRRINSWTYVIGVAGVLAALPVLDMAANPWLTSVVGAVAGSVIAVTTMAASHFVERSASQKSARAGKDREAAAATARMEALRH
jgi:uncharacterized membrane protein